MVQRGPDNAETRVLQPPAKPFSAGCGPLLDAGSALTKGGQVMFCPRPLHQLPELPSHVFSECAACLAQRSSQTAPFSILNRRGSYLSLARLPFSVCLSLPRPGLSLVIYILVAGRSWNCGFRPRLPLKSCGSCVVQRGSNNAEALAHACFA